MVIVLSEWLHLNDFLIIILECFYIAYLRILLLSLDLFLKKGIKSFLGKKKLGFIVANVLKLKYTGKCSYCVRKHYKNFELFFQAQFIAIIVSNKWN